MADELPDEDQELQDLIGELESDDDELEDEESEDTVDPEELEDENGDEPPFSPDEPDDPEPEEQKEEPEEEPKAELVDDEPDDLPLDVINPAPMSPSEAAGEILNLREVVANHNRDYDQIRSQLKADRAKTDGVINILLAKVQDDEAKSAEVQALVQALDILAKTNDSAVKLLDSKSRLVTSTKSSVQTMIQQNFNGGNSEELEDLLGQPDNDEA